MKMPHRLLISMILLTWLQGSLFAQFEPEKGIFKGQFKQTGLCQASFNTNRWLQAKGTDRKYVQNWEYDLWLLNELKVSYAFWSLLGDPASDYKFYWTMSNYSSIDHEYNNIAYHIRIEDLKKYPDLYKRFSLISPLPGIQLKVRLLFYANEKRGTPGVIFEHEIASCEHVMLIDLAAPAGKTENFSVPGAGAWSEMFTKVKFYWDNMTKSDPEYWLNKNKLKYNALGYEDPANKEEFSKSMRILFQNTKRIEVDPEGWRSTLRIKWPVYEIIGILDEYCRREEKALAAKTKAKPQAETKKEDDFWNTTGAVTTTKTTSDEDFWNTTATVPEQWTGKLDKADQLYDQKQWKEARAVYQEVASMNPALTYPANKVKFIDKLLAYKPKSDDSFTDPMDGKTYKIVTIGKQTWMAQNLNYQNGNSRCYNNNNSNCETYGRFYNWLDANNACPSGWHLPSENEFRQLLDFLGGAALTALKSTEGWEWNIDGTNSSGMNVLPGGGLTNYNNVIEYYGLGHFSSFWTATYDGLRAMILRIFNVDNKASTIDFIYEWKAGMQSVRCLKD